MHSLLCYLFRALKLRTKWIASYVFILFQKRHKRIFKYDMQAECQPFKVGFFIPAQEWDLECLSNEQNVDEIFCFGVNSSGECLTVQITRDCLCESSLYLKMDGCTYTLPTSMNSLKSDDKKIFGNNRFYIECLAPFRRWKIFFNGMLREISNTGDDHYVHVRFLFLWVASAGVYDFISDYCTSNIADLMSVYKWNSVIPPFKRFMSILNEYQQPGMLHGIVQVQDKEEHEMYLWGCRRHLFECSEKGVNHHINLFGNLENGLLFSFKVICVENFSKRNISGFIMKPNGDLKTAKFLDVQRVERPQKTILCFRLKAGSDHYKVCAFFYQYGDYFGKMSSENSVILMIDVLVNGVWGSGIAIERSPKKMRVHLEKCKSVLSFSNRDLISKNSEALNLKPLILLLDDPLCLNSLLTGNFGSNLSKLVYLRDEIKTFDIPEGFVLTTFSYDVFFPTIKLPVLLLKENISHYGSDELMPFCDRVVEEISNTYFPADIYDALCEKLNFIIKENEITTFSVFPSVVGSTCETQVLEAYLESFSDVIGLSDLIRCIKKCWASQFSFAAITCKSSSGLCLNTPMAVVVQKHVSFETAGTISTCASDTGNPSILEIKEKTSNDENATRVIVLERSLKKKVKISNTSIAHDINLKKGRHNLGNLPPENTSDDDILWLPNNFIVLLGSIANKLEIAFKSPLYIEWCFSRKRIFILQIRSAYFLNENTAFESLHSWGSYFRTEDEWFSIFNTGEGYYGAISPLGMNVLNLLLEILSDKLNNVHPELVVAGVPYYPKFLAFSHRHLFFNMAECINCFEALSHGLFVKTLPLVMISKAGEEQAFKEFLQQRYGEKYMSPYGMIRSILMLMFSGQDLKLSEKQINSYSFNLDEVNSALEILTIMSHRYQDIIEPFIIYLKHTYSAALWTMVVLNILLQIRRKHDSLEYVYQDLNFLMSTCSKPQEADIPLDMLALSKRIANVIDPDTFKKMPVDYAEVWIQDSEIDKKVKFSDFLKKHGHRSLTEIDVFDKCWSMEPHPVVQALQHIVPSVSSTFVSNSGSIDAIFNQLSVMPNCFQRYMLKYFVHKCVNAQHEARIAKSNLLKVVSFWRKAFYQLADKAVEEFNLPFPEALFFLSLDEIRCVLEEKSPHLVINALKCWNLQELAEKYLFSSVTVGFPTPLSGKFYADKRIEVGKDLKGCPVCRGTAIGVAVVARCFEDITDIQKGSILITPTPSVAWSLYFPVLGGFAADSGGLLSDGSISARDCGIPCVINLIRASHVFKTGDHVFIDGNYGILRRLNWE